MRMKEVCEKTGLTEKAVRLYVKEGLVSPQVQATTHTTGYHFSEEDVARLRDIAALRQAGFSLADIRQALEHPEKLPAMLEERSELLAEEIAQKQAVQEALERLTPAEQGEVSKAAFVLRNARALDKKDRPSKLPFSAMAKLILIPLSILCLFVVAMPNTTTFTMQARFDFACTAIPLALLPLLAVLCGFMGLRYLTCPLRARRLKGQGTGRVAAVCLQTGFDAAYARLGTKMGGNGIHEQGHGGIWTIWFLTWNEARPDHWFPLIQFLDDTGRQRAATYPYGWLKSTWQEGDEQAIAWDPRHPDRVYPLHAPWLTAKGLVYLAAAVLLGAAAAWCWSSFYQLLAAAGHVFIG